MVIVCKGSYIVSIDPDTTGSPGSLLEVPVNTLTADALILRHQAIGIFSTNSIPVDKNNQLFKG